MAKCKNMDECNSAHQCTGENRFCISYKPIETKRRVVAVSSDDTGKNLTYVVIGDDGHLIIEYHENDVVVFAEWFVPAGLLISANAEIEKLKEKKGINICNGCMGFNEGCTGFEKSDVAGRCEHWFHDIQ